MNIMVEVKVFITGLPNNDLADVTETLKSILITEYGYKFTDIEIESIKRV